MSLQPISTRVRSPQKSVRNPAPDGACTTAAVFCPLGVGISGGSAGRQQEVSDMSTRTIAESDKLERRGLDRREARARAHLGRFGIGTAGVVAVLVSAWGGIVPFVGPLFNYSGDGSVAWHWSLPHAVTRSRPRCIRRSARALRIRRVAGRRGRQGPFEPGDGGDAADGLWSMVRGRATGVARCVERWELFRGLDASACVGLRSRLQHRDGPDPGGLRCLRRWLGVAAPDAQATTDTRSATVDAVSGPVESGI